MTSEELPDWVQPGATVAVFYSKYGEKEVMLKKVARHTKTQIVLEDYHRNFYKNNAGNFPFKAVGSSEPWSSLCHLADPNDPKIIRIQQKTAIREQVHVVKRQAEALLRKEGGITVEQAQRIILGAQKLQKLIEAHEIFKKENQ